MCQATVLFGDEEVAQEVTGLQQIDEGVRLTAFFEEPKIVAGRVRTIDFLKHRVHPQPLENED